MYGAHEKFFPVFVFNQLVTEHILSIQGGIRVLWYLGLLGAVRLFIARVMFYIDPDGRSHTKDDLRNQLPPTQEEWRSTLYAVCPSGTYTQLMGAAFMFVYDNT